MAATRGVPIHGDRGAWDTENYPALHTADIYDTGLTRYHWTEAQLDARFASTYALQEWDTENVGVGLGYDATGKTGDYNYLAGSNAALGLIEGDNNIIIGDNTNVHHDTEDVVIIGSGAGSEYVYADSIIIGKEAGRNMGMWGSIVLGWQAASNDGVYDSSLYVSYSFVAGWRAGLNAQIYSSIMIGEYVGEEGVDIYSSVLLGDYAGSYTPYMEDGVGIGQGALYEAYVYNDIAIGYYAGDYMNADSVSFYGNNIVIGIYAGDDIQEAEDCIYMGNGAGGGTIGIENIGIGVYTISYGNAANYNTAVGAYAGMRAEGDYNWFGGYDAGLNIAGSNNTITGAEAGGGSSIASDIDNSIFYGYRAGKYERNSNRVHIGGPNPWLYGETDNNLARFFADLEVYNPGALGTETLNEGGFSLLASNYWDVTGSFTLVDGSASYQHVEPNGIEDNGTLTQTVAHMAGTAIGNTWYAFTYTVYDAGSIYYITATITDSFAEEEQYIRITEKGTHTAYFKSAASVGDFVINVSSLYGPWGGFQFMDFSLKQITGGDLYVNGTATMQGGVINNVTHIDDGDSPYTALSSDEVVFCDTDGGAITVNLPAGVEGTHYKIINCGTSGSDITVDANSAELVYGELTQTLRDGDVLDLNFSAVQGWY